MTDYAWYEEVSSSEPLMQGDIIEQCPLLVFIDLPDPNQITETSALIQALKSSVAVQVTRAIVMTQACDMAQRKVPNVTLCPVQHIEEHKKAWEEASEAKGTAHGNNQWQSYLKRLKDGMLWHLALLQSRQVPAGGISIPNQIVDFQEILSLPLSFLEAWIQKVGGNRLRLRPPYREHLPQAFARYFMRVGLPEDIMLPG